MIKFRNGHINICVPTEHLSIGVTMASFSETESTTVILFPESLTTNNKYL